MNMYIKNILMVCFLLLSANVFAEGFIAGTLVKTLTGYVPIEDIRINDYVLCYDSHNNVVEKPVLHIVIKRAFSSVRLYINDICVTVDKNQKFYCVDRSEWITALNLQQGVILRSNSNAFCVVKHIEFINEPREL